MTPRESRSYAPAPAHAPAPLERARTRAYDRATGWHHLSASQFKQFRECARRWWWQTVQGVSVPSSAAMRLGTSTHSELEAWGDTGAEPTHPSAKRAVRLVPEAAPGAGARLVETPLEAPSIVLAGVPVLGYVDLYVPARPLVVDWKTTSAVRWMKSEDELRVDPQAILYGEWATRREGVAGAAVAFVYALTRGAPGADRRDVWMSRALLDTGMAGLERDAQEMVRLAREAPGPEHLAAVPATWDACNQYGGCPHRGRCAADKTGLVAVSDVLNRLFADRASNDNGSGSNARARVAPTRAANDNARSEARNGSDSNAETGVANMSDKIKALFGSSNTSTGTGNASAPSPSSAERSDAAAPGLSLYINVVAEKGLEDERPRMLEGIIAEDHAPGLLAWWNRENGTGLTDLQQIDFGKWRGPLAASLRANPPRGCVFVRTGGALAEVALEVLRPMAAECFTGVR